MTLRSSVISLAAAVALLTLALPLRTFALQAAHADQVHYVGHLVAGRVLSLCPCTLQLAETQYAKGMYHARTTRQAALLTDARPTTLRARLIEAPQLVAAVLRRLG